MDPVAVTIVTVLELNVSLVAERALIFENLRELEGNRCSVLRLALLILYMGDDAAHGGGIFAWTLAGIEPHSEMNHDLSKSAQ